MIVAVTRDLIFGVKMQDAAGRVGQTLELVADGPTALAKASQPGARVILDLNLPGTDTVALIRDLKAAGVPVVAYVAHVQVDLRRAAVEAGADEVLARSVFVTRIDELVRGAKDEPAS